VSRAGGRDQRRNRELARRFREDLWNTADLTIADEIIAPDCIVHARVPFVTDFVRGPDAVRQLVLFYHLAFSDIRMTVDGLIAEGDTVAARWTGRGRHRGDLMGGAAGPGAAAAPAEGQEPAPAEGQPAPAAPPALRPETVTAGIDYLRFAEGRIAEGWVAWDILSLIEPLLTRGGATLPRGPLAEFLPLLRRLW
jgi:hypothetical protein